MKDVRCQYDCSFLQLVQKIWFELNCAASGTGECSTIEECGAEAAGVFAGKIGGGADGGGADGGGVC